jgi:hypothetical protein
MSSNVVGNAMRSCTWPSVFQSSPPEPAPPTNWKWRTAVDREEVKRKAAQMNEDVCSHLILMFCAHVPSVSVMVDSRSSISDRRPS